MTISNQSTTRQVVPRWRPWRTTVLLGETLRGSSKRSNTQPDDSVSKTLVAIGKHPSVGHAGDLLSMAVTLADERIKVQELAGELVGEYAGTLLADVAYSVLQSDEERHDGDVITRSGKVQERISYLRKILNMNPRNSLRWVDLAREYLMLGHFEKANRAMQIALHLNPDDRFVLRSASALYVQQGELDRALSLILRSDRTDQDPWLMAPAIAITDLLKSRQKMTRAARQLLDGDYSAIELSELGAAMGTIELSAGGDRRGRQLLRRSLVSPTENALAQVEWFANKHQMTIVEELPQNVPRAFEAIARRALFEGRWEEAIAAGRMWFQDQAFSANAAGLSSFAACEIEDFKAAQKFSLEGLRSNPTSPFLLNNLAFALIEEGDLASALERLKHARMVVASTHERIVLAATEALALFRSGYGNVGRERYNLVINALLRGPDYNSAAKASLMLAREEILDAMGFEVDSWIRANHLCEKATRSDVLNLQKRVSKMLNLGSTVDCNHNPTNDIDNAVKPILDPPEILNS